VLTGSTGEKAETVTTEDKPEYHSDAQQHGVEWVTVGSDALRVYGLWRLRQNRFEWGKGGATVRLLLHQIGSACRV
jgi:hypothetical protein